MEKDIKHTLNSETVDWKCELKYLGVNLVSGNVLKFNLQTVRQKDFRAFNGLLSKIGTRSPMVTLSIIDSFCVPLLSYGVEVLKLRKSDYNTLDAAYNAAFKKLFASYDKSVIRGCQYYCYKLPFSLKIDVNCLKFYFKMSRLNRNDMLRALFILSGQYEFKCLLKQYKLDDQGVPGSWEFSIWQAFSKEIMI